MLDPLDPLFSRLAAAFYEAQTQEFGAVKFLAADPFHEGGQLEGIDLAACGQAIHRALRENNPTATWVLQSWEQNPRQTMIDALDKSKLLVLDLHCEGDENWRARAQFGQTPWLWCTIQNWGGNVGLGGDLEGLRVKPARALAEAGPGKGRMRGIGALMEGSQTQPMLWEMFFQHAWRSDPPDLGPWLHDYARRRYGAASPAARQALQIELETVYGPAGETESVVCARPSLEPYPKARFWGSTEPHYATPRLGEAWRLMIEAAAACGGSDGYRYDLTDLGRQVLADLAGRYHRMILQAYTRKDAATVGELGIRMLGLLRDLDELLATRREFLLGIWLNDARKSGGTPEEQALCERGARELLTIWCSQDSNSIDYANRQWAGLVGTFYFARWQTWLSGLQAALGSGQPIDVAAVRARIRDDDRTWTRQHEAFPVEPRGQTIEISRRLFQKYRADVSGG
jgi:alpha-N-acetylglucosaminidase